MRNVQYFVFDKTGNEILEAGGIPCDNDKEVEELANTMKNNFHSNPQFENTQLLISCGKKVLFNSKTAVCRA